MFKKIVLGAVAMLALVVVVFVIAVAMQPAEYRVERSLAMKAPPEEVFHQVNDFHNWQAWSPWAELDPDAKVTFEGPTAGEGAIFRWAGNDQVGEGSMTILESQPNERIRMRLDFLKPMEDTANVEFTLQPVGEQTKVNWAMFGQNNFVGRAMCMFMDMDQMIGSDYEKGLANIQAIVEAEKAGDEPATAPAATAPNAEPAQGS
jgi:uncharacterized protein YndB with AHSA1/START domain